MSLRDKFLKELQAIIGQSNQRLTVADGLRTVRYGQTLVRLPDNRLQLLQKFIAETHAAASSSSISAESLRWAECSVPS